MCFSSPFVGLCRVGIQVDGLVAINNGRVWPLQAHVSTAEEKPLLNHELQTDLNWVTNWWWLIWWISEITRTIRFCFFVRETDPSACFKTRSVEPFRSMIRLYVFYLIQVRYTYHARLAYIKAECGLILMASVNSCTLFSKSPTKPKVHNISLDLTKSTTRYCIGIRVSAFGKARALTAVRR